MSDPVPVPQPTPPSQSNIDPGGRWQFLRDVAVFELKLVLNNFHNFFQVPLTLAVAAFDLFVKAKEGEGARFYKLVEIGRTIDDSIDIYSIIDHRERSLNKDYTVDAVISQLETVIVREYEKGGSAATVKQAVDKAMDKMQLHTGTQASRAADAVKAVAEKLHDKMQKLGGDQP